MTRHKYRNSLEEGKVLLYPLIFTRFGTLKLLSVSIFAEFFGKTFVSDEDIKNHLD